LTALGNVDIHVWPVANRDAEEGVQFGGFPFRRTLEAFIPGPENGVTVPGLCLSDFDVS
jgi:hypothetical protein